MRYFGTALVAFLSLLVPGCDREAPTQTGVDESTLSVLVEPIPDRVDYNFDVRPILSSKCFLCHGPDPGDRKAGIRLDQAAATHAPLAGQPGKSLFAPGSPENSYAFERITAEDASHRMPPVDSERDLSDREKEIIRRWITQGARYDKHWAYKYVEKPPVPKLGPALKKQAVNEIDHFVFHRLKERQIAPAPAVGLEKYIRRVAFDATGLPPELEELDRFLPLKNDKTVYEQIVDYYLSRPGYGERMATEWLDVARYADTFGYQGDAERPMWPWRDWVIKAINDNLPYDRFMTEQLAGDLIPNASRSQIIATAFNRNHKQTEEGGSINEEFRVSYVSDRTDTFGKAMLGVTLECASCHDHKYDPLTQKEYYQVYSFFNNIDEAGQNPWTGAVPQLTPGPALLLSTEAQNKQLTDLWKTRKTLEDQLVKVRAEASPQFEDWKDGLSQYSIPLEPVHPNALDIENISAQSPPEQRSARAWTMDGDKEYVVEGNFGYDAWNAFTILFWARSPKVYERAVLMHHTRAALDAASHGYEMLIEDGKVTASLAHMWPFDAIKVKTLKPLALNTWVQIAMVYDGSMKAAGIQIYINGKPAKTEVVKDSLTRSIVSFYTEGERKKVKLTFGARWRGNGFKGGMVSDPHVFETALTPLEIRALYGGNVTVSGKADTALLAEYYFSRHHDKTGEIQAKLTETRQKIIELTSEIQAIMVMQEMETPRRAWVLKRGEYDQHGEPVSPGTPKVLPAFNKQYPQNRYGLAQWLTDRKNPLAARVAVNRYWQTIFGRGIVETPQDFGNQGSLPTHPALLDWLAADFMEHQWDLKRLIRNMLLSASYRQSTMNPAATEKDPGNRLWSRSLKRRLSAEMIRDNMLASSGLLVRKTGGPAVKPYQPDDVWAGTTAKTYKRGKGDELYRRSIYTFWKRTAPPPNMLLFDAVERNVCEVQRRNSSSPLQSLVLFNDEQFVEACKKLAERIALTNREDTHAAISQAFRLLTSRFPKASESNTLKKLYDIQKQLYTENRPEADAFVTIGDSTVDKSIDTVELASLASVVTAIMNFDETVFRY